MDHQHKLSAIPSNTIIVYTDGSFYKIDGATGAGAVFMKNGRVVMPPFHWPVSMCGSNYMGELVAVRNALKELIILGIMNCTVEFFIDCASVIQLLTTWADPDDHVESR